MPDEKLSMDVSMYAEELGELVSHLNLTPAQDAAAHVALQRLDLGAATARMKARVTSAKMTLENVTYQRLKLAESDGRLAGPNSDARKLARETVEATDTEILAQKGVLRDVQMVHDEADAVYSNLYHLLQVLLEAVQRENTG